MEWVAWGSLTSNHWLLNVYLWLSRLDHDHWLLRLCVTTYHRLLLHWLTWLRHHHRLLLVNRVLSIGWLSLHYWLCDRNIAILHKWFLIVHLIVLINL